MDEQEAIKILKDFVPNEGDIGEIINIKSKTYLSKDEFSVGDNELFNNECYIVVFTHGNGLPFVIDTVTGKVYESLAKNRDGKRALRLAKKKK